MLRVVILSATIDEDEPNYRRYYRAINDNQKYPYDINLRNNKLDRINVDRRFHISAPGTGTRFVVTEKYMGEDYDIMNLIKELIDGRKGDILVFQPGEADIIKMIEEGIKTYAPLPTERRKPRTNAGSTEKRRGRATAKAKTRVASKTRKANKARTRKV